MEKMKKNRENKRERRILIMAKIQLTVYNVCIMYPAKKEYIQTSVAATTNVKAFMKALKASKWANVDVDKVLFHTDKVAFFDVEE